MKSQSTRFFIRLCGVVGILITVGLLIWFGTIEKWRIAEGEGSEAVSVEGTVVPAEAVDLAFGASGTIGTVNNLVGDTVSSSTVIAALDNAPVRADLAEAQASLRLENAKLAGFEAVSYSDGSASDAATHVVQAKLALLTTLHVAHLSTEDAVYNKSDIFFSAPNSNAPQLLFSASSTSQMSIESGRVEVGARLANLNTLLAQATTTDDLESLSLSVKEDIAEANLFLDTTALSLNALGTSSSSSQPIALWQSNLAVAQTEVSNAISSIFAADKDLADSEALLSETQSTGPSQDIALEQSRIATAAATVAHLEAMLRNRSIISPIAGIITKQDAKLGEQAVADVPLVSVMSTSKFQVEAAIPESLVSRITVGAVEQVTLDAYGSEVHFTAGVISIDPEDISTSSVSMYKTLFQFSQDDARIKSGMTAHISIRAL